MRARGRPRSAVLADGLLHPLERDMLSDFASKHSVSETEHARTIKALGWRADEFERGIKTELSNMRGGAWRGQASGGEGGASGAGASGATSSATSGAIAPPARKPSRIEKAVEKAF